MTAKRSDWSFGGPAQVPIVRQTSASGCVTERRMRRLASAAPRRTNHEIASPMAMPMAPTRSAIVASQQLETLERVVVELRELLLRRRLR